MKAAVQHKYGSPDAITIENLPKPIPADDQVLVRVHAATVGVVDALARKGEPAYARIAFGLRRPRHPILGNDFAGQIEAVGQQVTRFKPGDQVFGTSAPHFGAHAEYLGLPETAALCPDADRADRAGRPDELRRRSRPGRCHRPELSA